MLSCRHNSFANYNNVYYYSTLLQSAYLLISEVSKYLYWYLQLTAKLTA